MEVVRMCRCVRIWTCCGSMLAHIRRAVFEARSDAPLAVDLVWSIQKLYRIESRARRQGGLEARWTRKPRSSWTWASSSPRAPGPQEPLGGAELAETKSMARYWRCGAGHSTDTACGLWSGKSMGVRRRGREGRQSLLAHDHVQAAGGEPYAFHVLRRLPQPFPNDPHGLVRPSRPKPRRRGRLAPAEGSLPVAPSTASRTVTLDQRVVDSSG